MRDQIQHPRPEARMREEEREALRAKQRSKNLAVLAGLVGLAVLFYAITILKMAPNLS